MPLETDLVCHSTGRGVRRIDQAQHLAFGRAIGHEEGRCDRFGSETRAPCFADESPPPLEALDSFEGDGGGTRSRSGRPTSQRPVLGGAGGRGGVPRQVRFAG